MKRILAVALVMGFSASISANDADTGGPNPCMFQHSPKTFYCEIEDKRNPQPSFYGKNKIEFKGMKAADRGWPQSPEDARQ